MINNITSLEFCDESVPEVECERPPPLKVLARSNSEYWTAWSINQIRNELVKNEHWDKLLSTSLKTLIGD